MAKRVSKKVMELTPTEVLLKKALLEVISSGQSADADVGTLSFLAVILADLYPAWRDVISTDVLSVALADGTRLTEIDPEDTGCDGISGVSPDHLMAVMPRNFDNVIEQLREDAPSWMAAARAAGWGPRESD